MYCNFQIGWFAEPLTFGDYPQLIKDVVDKNSALQNFSKSRLPRFTTKEKFIIKGSYDLFFLNHYSGRLVTPAEFDITPSWDNDKQINSTVDSSWTVTSSGFTVSQAPSNCNVGKLKFFQTYPPAFRLVLNYIKENYKNPAIWVTENGYSDSGGVNDTGRIGFIKVSLQ